MAFWSRCLPVERITRGLLLGLSSFGIPAEAGEGDFEPASPASHWAAHAGTRVRLVSAGVGSLPGSPSFDLDFKDEDAAHFGALPRRLLLDHATPSIRLGEAVADAAVGSGSGVLVGIVDSGVDLFHPDLRTADGASRLLYWIDFGRGPLGFHPELEADYGCAEEKIGCGILGPSEIAALVQGQALTSPAGARIDPPEDRLGHGTLVASLALGNGASDPRFTGIAPEASLIAARVATTGVLVDDLDVAVAARFVFERARELGMPAVLNLSLGGDMGPHDGSSALELILSDWVRDAPGRAVVVAAGNSGTLEPSHGPYPGPLGIHTGVHVPKGTRVRVPILFPDHDSERAVVYVWIAADPGAEVAVGLERADGRAVLPFVRRGEAKSAAFGRAQATLVHHVESDAGIADTERGIALILSGVVPAGEVFALIFEGEASLDLWLQSEGELAPEAGNGRASFPAATRERTVTIPATSEDVIAVGAAFNRDEWTSFERRVELVVFDEELRAEPGAVLPFSSAGPNALGLTKPDLVAPGGVVVGALAQGADAVADGRGNSRSIFGQVPFCDGLACAQVDAWHGAAIGTSVSAPLVTGAAALLLERRPTLTHHELRALLQSGARRASARDPHAGSGLLDIQLAATALDDVGSNPSCVLDEERSWVSFSQSFAVPGGPSVHALLHLRTASGALCDVVPAELEVRVKNGSVTAAPRLEARGLHSLRLGADSGRAGDSLAVTVAHRSRRFTSSLPIAVDAATLERGVSTRGGCATRGGTRRSSALSWLAFLVLIVWRNRSKIHTRCLTTASW